jgi:PAS domain S-box-containing protein
MKDITVPRNNRLEVRETAERLESLDANTRSLETEVKKFRTMVEHANDAIFIVQDEQVKYANPKALSLARITSKHLEKVRYTDFVHPEDRSIVIDKYDRRLKGEEFPNVYPVRILTPQGESVWTELNSVRFSWEDKPALLCIIRDITSQRLLEQHGLRTESLETLKTLSGGLAHSFNNLLMGIQGRISILKEITKEKEDAADHLKGMQDCIREASKLTRQMLGFAQAGKYKVEPVDLNGIVETVLDSFRPDNEHIEIKTVLLRTPCFVAGDRKQLEMAIMNLLLNALQALGSRGEIILKTENVTLSGTRLPRKNLKQLNWTKLSIQDNGCGIDSTTMIRVFEPFFTTKNLEKHRGLGLSSAYGIVANHDGMIDIQSRPSAGTTVSLFLPALEKRVK